MSQTDQNINTHLDIEILDHLLEGFQLIDFDWRYLYVNKSAANQSKFSKKDLLGYTIMEKYPNIEETELFKVLQRCMHERISDQIENEFTYADGSKGWFELRIEPVPEGLFILSINITERKLAEENLSELNQLLEEKVILRTLELTTKNQELLDSLNYAKHIQRSKLTPKEDIYKAHPESFILFKPKAIVSGDFYFFHEDDLGFYIASADCTGHGVPGALMTMVCSEKLHNAVLEYDCTSKILKNINQGIKVSLRQLSHSSQSKDGMDIALCSFNKETRTLQYSGANRPLWILRNDQTEVEEIKGTKQSIGGYTDEEQHYTKHEIELQKGDTFYIFSDGYVDQFGGEKGKKLSSAKFKTLLLSIQDKSMQNQKQDLADFFKEWQADMEQIDDVLVIGMRA
tara:strand:+ start:149 stop:1348 length:1200 start_codon:yes stop_codon:yes gene_type:complete